MLAWCWHPSMQDNGFGMNDIVEKLRHGADDSKYPNLSEFPRTYLLIAAKEIERLREAIAAEREACASVVDHFTGSLWTDEQNLVALTIQNAIRSRKDD